MTPSLTHYRDMRRLAAYATLFSSLQFARFDAIVAQDLQQLFDLFAPACFERQINLDATDFQVRKSAVVFDFQDVAADLRRRAGKCAPVSPGRSRINVRTRTSPPVFRPNHAR
jgi:hypothetical protein